MKIFLNNRTVQFTAIAPENQLPTDMVVKYESAENLKEAYEDFERYEKYLNLWIWHADSGLFDGASAFKVFVSIFKFIPAAGGLVKNEKGEYLFIHRLGHWDLPKGKIDKKDMNDPATDANRFADLINGKAEFPPHPSSAGTAAIREVREETGLKSVKITRDLTSTWHIYKLKDKRILKQTWWFEMEADSAQVLKPQTSEGIFLVKWTSPNAIHCILTHTYASIRELLLEVFFV
ncbi:MAG: NUDIX domain-containing protein [Bacteroidota bacterium]